MLTALRIGNFKAFAETQRIPVRPLTLIYGANSSGKSSVLHSLILARHALETGDLDVHRTNVGGESVDLGGFRQYVHRRDVNRRVEWAVELDTASVGFRSLDLASSLKHVTIAIAVGIALDDQGQPVLGALPEVYSYEILDDKKSLIRMSKRKNELNLDFVEFEHPIFTSAIQRRFGHLFSRRRSGIDFQGVLAAAVGKALPNLLVVTGKLLPERIGFQIKGINTISSFTPRDFQTFASIRMTPEFSAFQRFIRSLIPGNLEKEHLNDLEFSIRGSLDILSEFIARVADGVYEEMMRLRYLGPLRSYPPRHLAFSQHHDPNWYAGGGYAWDVVRRDANVRKLVNEWLSAPDRLQTPYELVLRDLVGIDQLEGPLLDGLERLNEEGLDLESEPDSEYTIGGVSPIIKDPEAEAVKIRDLIRASDIDKLNELIMVDRRSNTVVSHRDVGIGVSQVLPVLVAAYASRNQIIAIEQPEIHLHPALHADLGDVFIQSALGPGRNRFLIETHSEHLLLRVMRRMRETSNKRLPEGVPRITPKDVCVLFVEPDGSRSIVREMPLNENGELVKAWPGGFFEEGLREVF